jgi:hypothetical protein
MTLSLPTFSLFKVKPGLILRPLICMPAENLDDSKEDSCSKLQKSSRKKFAKMTKKIVKIEKNNRGNRGALFCRQDIFLPQNLKDDSKNTH